MTTLREIEQNLARHMRDSNQNPEFRRRPTVQVREFNETFYGMQNSQSTILFRRMAENQGIQNEKNPRLLLIEFKGDQGQKLALYANTFGDLYHMRLDSLALLELDKNGDELLSNEYGHYSTIDIDRPLLANIGSAWLKRGSDGHAVDSELSIEEILVKSRVTPSYFLANLEANGTLRPDYEI